MSKKHADYIRDIRRALKKVAKYNTSLEFQIFSLAASMRALELAVSDIDGLESTSYTGTNRYGNESRFVDPAFKVLKEQQDAVTKQMKALGLTAEDLVGTDDNDPLVEMTRKLTEEAANRKPVIIKPEVD